MIVLTANAVSGAKEMYLEEGFVDYMSKPIQGKRLEEKIVEFLPEDKYVMIEYDDMEKKLYQNLWKAVADDIMSEYQFKILDIPMAVESAEGDKDCVIFLFESFRDNVDKNKTDIVSSYEKEDYSNYTIFVHALKSTSKMIGAQNLSEMARKMEESGKAGDFDYIKANYDAMIAEYDAVVAEINDYLSNR